MHEQKAIVFYNNKVTGYLSKVDGKYFFKYDEGYVNEEKSPSISLSLPKRMQPYESDKLFAFFYGLLAEGDNKEIQCRKLKIDERDHFTRLIKTATENTIGAITVKEERC
jgi:serine/threonine-protein kinase HipA